MLPQQKAELQPEKQQHGRGNRAAQPPESRLPEERCCDVGRSDLDCASVGWDPIYWPHKTIAATGHSFYKSRILSRISQRISQPLDGRIQTVVEVNEGVRWP
jgi:hypothetical protein